MKCAKCHQTISPPSSAVTYRSKSYCSACFSTLKDQAAKKDKKTSALLNDPDFLDLSSYLCSLFSIQELTPLLRKQVSEYHNEKHWSWKSISLAAKYFFELSPSSLPKCSKIYSELLTTETTSYILAFIKKISQTYSYV